MSIEILTTLGPAAIATAVAAALSQILRPMISDNKNKREKNISKLKEQIEKKISSGIQLESKEVTEIGKGLDIPSSHAVNALYQLYSESNEKETHEIYKKLIEEINRSKPFESLPDEVRPSLSRLSSLCSESGAESDKELLHPIVKVLGDYQDMQRDHASIKRQGRISYIVALLSFFIGITGLILAFSGPSKKYITEELKKSNEQIIKEFKNKI